ncbi:hypothetical protein [Bacillus cihuensis]|uniref:hypothetical protein n=1 Tax=Bacillus cihuensis TaxID=1208599 RepID=UPI0003FDFCAA|nr:hypothetical protein [Bacillus cihuensis]
MKQQKHYILMLGTRDKTDFGMYLSHVFSGLDKKVLLVDSTEKQLYRDGYTTLGKDRYLYDFQGVDILTGVKDWNSINTLLEKEDEKLSTYDVVLVDVDNLQNSLADWSGINTQLYVGDYERMNMQKDKQLLTRYIDETGNNEFFHISYYVRNKLEPDFFDELTGYRIQWKSLPIEIEFDEVDLQLRIIMQHNLQIPFKRLSNGYKEALTSIVTAIYGLHKKEVMSVFNHSFMRIPRKLLTAE